MLAGKCVEQLEVHGKLAGAGGCYPANYHVVATGALPIGKHDAGRRCRRRRHAFALQSAETATAFEIVLNDLRNVQPAVSRRRASKGHDRDRHRIGDTGGDLDLQLRQYGPGGTGCDGGGRRQAPQDARCSLG